MMVQAPIRFGGQIGRERGKMIKSEIKKNVISVYFVISVLLLYIIFLLGDSGQVLPGGMSTTIIGAIWSKFHGNWEMCSDSSFLVRMNAIWDDNRYLPILMPVICGLPGAMVYLGEIGTGNKRLILTRCSLKSYYISKIVANFVCSVLISVFSIFLYYITLVFFFDHIPVSDDSFRIIYFVFSGNMPENSKDISWYLIIYKLLKGILYFCFYSVMCSSFCYFMAVWCRDKYTAFGGTVFICYMQSRIVEELVRKYIMEGITVAGTAADILNPIFLHFAGDSGFYQNKEGLAVLLTFSIILFYYFMTVYLSQKQLDVSER